MREARLILPSIANYHIAGQLEARLIEAFAGFTVTTSTGAWDSGGGTIMREPVDVYDIAMELTPESNAKMFSTISWLFAMTDERTIYYRNPLGDVCITKRPLDTPTRATI